jgi:ABC-type sugar transport system substrate-binding protein
MRAVTTGGAAAAALALTAGLGLAACSSSSTSSSSAPASTQATATASTQASATTSASAASATSCGAIPTTLPSDPDGVIAALPSSLQTLYNGYPTTVYKSAFASWKPKSTSNKTVGFLLSETNNGYQLALAAILEGMLKSAGYTVDAVTSSDEVTDQVADFNQMVEKKVAMIVYEPLSSTAVSNAAAAGIPSISVLNSVGSADTISIGANDWLQGAQMAAQVATDIGGTGKVLDVHGISGVGIDIAAFDGVHAVFAHCPNISTDDTIYTQFADSTAKSDVQTYLETHPQKIAAAITSGAGATGVLEGFQAAGKSVPEIANDSLEDGELAYWDQNKSSYKGVGITATPPQIAAATTTIVNDLFKGDGVKISAIVLNTPLVTDANVDQWYVKGTTSSSTGNASGPTSLNVLPASELAEVVG